MTSGTMKAMVLRRPGPAESEPLRLEEVPIPVPGPGEVLLKVRACGVCHTDLHTIEGELEPHREAVIPGHQIVGEVVALGDWPGERPAYPAADGEPLRVGERVGVPWLWRTDGTCAYCRSDRENLCEHPLFTGYDVDGGYAEYHVAQADFVYRLPDMDDLAVAPLLCAGIIGYRALRLAGVVDDPALPGWRRTAPAERPAVARRRLRPASSAGVETSRGGDPRFAEAYPFEEKEAAVESTAEAVPAGRLGIFGFGAAAHICLQIAAHRGWEVYVFTRAEHHRVLARDLGAAWAGPSAGRPDTPGWADAAHGLDAAIVFAPAGELALHALALVQKGGIVALGGIHSSPIPPIDYPVIYGERVLRSVANSTRQDALDLLREVAEVPVRTEVEVFPLEAANDALLALKQSRIGGAAVLKVD